MARLVVRTFDEKQGEEHRCSYRMAFEDRTSDVTALILRE